MQLDLNHISLFTGAGGIDIGFEAAGFKNRGFVEHWKPAIETVMKNSKSVLIKEDIRRVQKEDFKGIQADVVSGGPPCQGYSMAGNRDKEDSRNTLFKDYLRCVDYLKPKFCVMENVKGIYTMLNEKNQFVFNEIYNEFRKRGYLLKVKILNSSNYGVPQKRQRVIFVANNLGIDYQFPKAQEKKVFVSDVLDLPYQEDKSMQHVYPRSTKLMKKAFYLKNKDKISSFGSTGVKLNFDFAPAITKSGRYIHPKFNRLISVREAARLQTFPDSWQFCGSINDMYGQIGNAVPCKMAEAIGITIRQHLESYNSKLV